MHWNDLNLEKSYEMFAPYAQSKLAMVLFTIELADRLKGFIEKKEKLKYS